MESSEVFPTRLRAQDRKSSTRRRLRRNLEKTRRCVGGRLSSPSGKAIFRNPSPRWHTGQFTGSANRKARLWENVLGQEASFQEKGVWQRVRCRIRTCDPIRMSSSRLWSSGSPAAAWKVKLYAMSADVRTAGKRGVTQISKILISSAQGT